jgi:hypothetical protein
LRPRPSPDGRFFVSIDFNASARVRSGPIEGAPWPARRPAMRLRVVYHGDIYFGAEDRQVEPRYFGQNEAKFGGVGAPWGRGGGRTRRGRGNRDED